MFFFKQVNMLKRYGASSKHRKAAGALQSSAIGVTSDQPETTHEEPLSIIENNKVTIFSCSAGSGGPVGWMPCLFVCVKSKTNVVFPHSINDPENHGGSGDFMLILLKAAKRSS